MAGMNDSFKPATACLSFDPRSTMDEEEEEERWLGATRVEEKKVGKKRKKRQTRTERTQLYLYIVYLSRRPPLNACSSTRNANFLNNR